MEINKPRLLIGIFLLTLVVVICIKDGSVSLISTLLAFIGCILSFFGMFPEGSFD